MIARRLIEKEFLDLPEAATREEIRGNLRDIVWANRWLGGTSAILYHLSRLIGSADHPVRILDMATGAADIPAAIVRWARKHRVRVEIKAVDKNPFVLEFAQELARPFPEISLEQQNILTLPYSDASFDFATCSQVTHHLENDQVIRVLRDAGRLAIQGIVISDLRRRPLCTHLAKFASQFILNRLSSHDARVSFGNAFTPGEVYALAKEADLSCPSVYLHGLCRLALVAGPRCSMSDSSDVSGTSHNTQHPTPNTQ